MNSTKEDKIFLDSNIIIYAYDKTAGNKCDIANQILVDLWNIGNGIISTQVLSEFFVNVTRKIRTPLNAIQAKEIVKDLLKWQVVVNYGNSILNVIDLQIKYKYSFWDSMILQSAISSDAKILLSEDFSHGQTIEGVKIENPFL